MNRKFIPYGKHFIDEEDIKVVVEVLKSDFITQGKKVREFEERLAKTCGAKYCVVFNSGTSALISAYRALGLGKGDEFITSPITFVATANAGLHLRAKPVFVDVEPDTGNLDVNLVEEKITQRTKLIVPVHYAGHPVDMAPIKEIADRYGIRIVEDACHALGAKYKGYPIGSCQYSDAVVFSFHPVKHITTAEGGAVLTNNEEIYEKLLRIRNHGIVRDRKKFLNPQEGDWYYEVQDLGFNFRLTDIQCALGISQLSKLERFVKRRREIANIYDSALAGSEHFDLPTEKDYAYHSYHLYPLRLKGKALEEKAKLVRKLRERGIGTQVHYIPVYLHPLYRRLGYKAGLCPNAEMFYRRELSIPIYPGMKEEDVNLVIHTMLDSVEEVIGL